MTDVWARKCKPFRGVAILFRAYKDERLNLLGLFPRDACREGSVVHWHYHVPPSRLIRSYRPHARKYAEGAEVCLTWGFQ